MSVKICQSANQALVALGAAQICIDATRGCQGCPYGPGAAAVFFDPATPLVRPGVVRGAAQTCIDVCQGCQYGPGAVAVWFDSFQS